MATSKVRTPRGIVTVTHDAGASREDIIALAKLQASSAKPESDSGLVSIARRLLPTPKTPVAPEGEPVRDIPSVGSMIGKNLTERSGDILSMAGGTVAPGSGLLGFASRLLGAEAGHDVGRALTGQKIAPGYGAGTQALGEGVARVAAPLLSPSNYRAFANRSARAVGDWLKRSVPAWSNFPATAKGLYEMAHGTGQRVLSNEFETELRALKAQIPETYIVEVPTTIEVGGRIDVVSERRNARALIDDLPELRKAGNKAYRAALKALSDQLPSVAPALDAARAAYRNGAGFIEFADKGKFLYGERFDPVNAMKALDKYGKLLTRRGMDELRGLVRGPGEKPIEAVKHNPFVRRIEGALAGGAMGLPLGLPHAIGGAAGGLIAGEMLPKTTYRNVPLSPAARWAARFAPAGIAEAGRETARDIGIAP